MWPGGEQESQNRSKGGSGAEGTVNADGLCNLKRPKEYLPLDSNLPKNSAPTGDSISGFKTLR